MCGLSKMCHSRQLTGCISKAFDEDTNNKVIFSALFPLQKKAKKLDQSKS